MAHFITDQCIGCTLCMKSCPVGAIGGSLKQRHAVNAARCVDCGVCGRVCPRGAVTDADGKVCLRVAKSLWPKPMVDAALCSACCMCVEACGKDALELTLPAFAGDLKVYAFLKDESACVGCGVCAGACPLGAIAMRGGGEQ